MILDNVKLARYSKEEELANSLSHGLGALFAIGVFVVCLARAVQVSGAAMITAAAVYGASMVILYGSSTAYHSFPVGTAKKILRIVDHSMIFLLIAGSATPFALISVYKVSPALAWTVFGVVWTGLAVGISATVINFEKSKKLQMVLYLGLGWAMVFLIKPMLKVMPKTGIALIIAGGLLYTVGTIFYAAGKKVKYMHTLFHIFVLAGSAVHFVCIYKYVLA